MGRGQFRHLDAQLGGVELRLCLADRRDPRAKKDEGVWFGITANLLALLYFKYSNFLIDNVNLGLALAGLPIIGTGRIPLPLGISFLTFHAISYLTDVYRQTIRAERKLSDLALYILLFPHLIAGPIVRYADIASQMKKRGLRADELAYGIRRFILGLAKKMLIANQLAVTADQIFGIPLHELDAGLAWLAVICYTFQIYFDFSGYSDMAIGLAHMFGFTFHENFDHPYIVAVDHRVLAALAHLALDLVSRLCVYPAGRKPVPAVAGLPQSLHRIPALRVLARCELELRDLGPVPGVVSGHREVGANVGAATTLETLAACLPRGRRDGRLGLLPARDHGASGARAPRHGVPGQRRWTDVPRAAVPDDRTVVDLGARLPGGNAALRSHEPECNAGGAVAHRALRPSRLCRLALANNACYLAILVLCLSFVAQKSYNPFIYFRF